MLLALALAALFVASDARAQEAPAGTPGGDANLARVGDEFITQAQYLRELGFKVRQATLRTGKPFQPDARFRKETFEAMVQARILSILARNAHIEVPEENVNEEFARRRALIPTEEAFQDYLKQEGLTKETLLEEIRRRMIVEAYVEDVSKDLKVAPEEIETQYKQWDSRGLTKRKKVTYDIGLILIRPATMDEAGWSSAELIVNDARHRIQEGEKFTEVAKELSSDLSAAERGGIFEETFGAEFLPEINEKITTLDPGTLSEPFKSEVGWHLVQVISRNEPGVIPFDKVAPRLESFLLEQKQTELLRQKVAEAQAYVDIEVFKADNLPEPPPTDLPVQDSQ
ncbi:MAG: peptidylprolyl isomerase [Candidatus Hydrogenedentes bacterium]|nr:peptidylprolyl isomerase [Candidatus Hydrogenedentota bacterium]